MVVTPYSVVGRYTISEAHALLIYTLYNDRGFNSRSGQWIFQLA
jgi:hypothetical protein